MIATYLKKSDQVHNGVLFHVSPAIDGHKFVVVSAVNSPFDTGIPETFIFPASKNGKIESFGELNGSRRGIDDVEGLLAELGYQIVKEVK